jgi:hypothetical protein
MGKQKIPDSELLEKLRDNQHISYYATAEIVGLRYNTDFINRCHKLERLYKIPAKISTKYGKSKPEPKPEAAEIIKSSVAITRFPFRPNEQVYYEDRLCTAVMVTAEKITLRRNADMRHITITIEEYIQNPKILRQIDEKPPLKNIYDEKRTVIATDKPVFEPIDYIDPEWGKPTFGQRMKNFIGKLRGEK